MIDRSARSVAIGVLLDSYPHLASRNDLTTLDCESRNLGVVVVRTAVRQRVELRLLIERVDYGGEAGTIVVTFQPSGIRTLLEQAQTGDAA